MTSHAAGRLYRTWQLMNADTSLVKLSFVALIILTSQRVTLDLSFNIVKLSINLTGFVF